MPETKEMQQNLDAFGKELQEQLEQIQVEFNNRYAEFEKAQATMNPTVKQMKQAELNGLQQRYAEFQQIAQQDFAKMQQRYAEFQQIAQQDFAKKQQELAAPIQKKLDDAIAKVAKTAGYTAVFDAMMFVYADAAQVVDINGAVKKELGITEAAAQ